jgi:hypothetical protein
MLRHLLSPLVTKAVAGLVVGCALLALPARARAQTEAAQAPPPPATSGGGALGQGFGEQGQIAISGEMNAGFDKVNHAGWTLHIQPAGDYFIMPMISVGVTAALILGDQSYVEELIGGRGGFNLNVTENLGIWGKVGFALDHSSAKNTLNQAVSNTVTFLTLDVPITYHIIPHVFVGLGPYYYLKVSGTGNTGYGVHSFVGGWF